MQDAFGAKDWLGKTTMEVFPNELGEKLTANDKDSMELGFQKIEESLLQLDGKIHHYETQKFTIDRLGMEPWLGGISLDITERKLAERLLRESQEQLDLVIKGSNDAPWDWNLVKDQLFYSLKWWQQIGYTPEEIPSDSSLWRNLTHPDDVGHVTDVLEKVLESKNDSYECEFRLLHKKGHYVPVLSRGFITRDSTGKPTRITGSNMDLTERKKAENEVLNAKNEAEKANFAKSEFLSRMSHELRTPMNSILGFAQLMEMGDLNPKQTKGVNHILTSGKYLLKLIDEVLDISRIEAGKLTLSPEPVQVGSIIMEMLESIQPLIASRHIKIIHTISSNDERYVRADRQRLKQVLLNLLTNAVKYNREGGTISISKTVMAPSEGCDACMQISISDTGLGISEEGMFKIFTPFERIGAEKTKTEGTGLGLAVVKKFMEAMDGNVGVASKQGEGSTFWIELPLDGNTKSRKLLKEENKKLTAELGTANTEIGFQNEEKTKRADELKLANVELAFQNEEKVKRTDELKDARKEIDFLTNQNREQAVELDHANQELSFRNDAPTNTGTILYIEDNESNIELIQQIIANQRPNIRLVSHLTGEESVAKAIGCAPDFILLDLDLPDLHGSQVFEQLKANEKTKDIPVVIISADAMPLQYEKLMQAGAKDYITKPVDIVVFLKAVDAWIGKGRIT
jgi:PAS domain S-box-containing protein